MIENGIDHTSVEGATTLPYHVPNIAVDLHTTDVGVPVLWWRAVGSTHTAYSTEAFIDELAEAAGKDPVAFRLDLLAEHPRHAGVLRLAAEKARSEENTSELQSLMRTSYAVICLKKKNIIEYIVALTTS